MENVLVSKYWMKYIRKECDDLMFASGVLEKVESVIKDQLMGKIDKIAEELNEIMQLTRRKIVTMAELNYALEKCALIE